MRAPVRLRLALGRLLSRSGEVAVEYAIVAPAFLLFVFGILEAGRLLWVQVTLDRAVSMAARCSSVNTAVCGTLAQVQSYAATQTPGMTIPAATFTLSQTTTDSCVSAAYTFPFVATYMFGVSVPLTSKACFPL